MVKHNVFRRRRSRPPIARPEGSLRRLHTMDLMAADDRIRIAGAREHNLKDISLELPRNALIVITGLSGSGKSSLAFDTIYAEGQRRYVESLSAYARQFLGQMDKPDVDSIEGLSPAISIDQKTTSRNPRSTVGTVTEIYDYLRLLWARVGHPHCYNCGEAISGQSVEQIIDHVMTLPPETRFMVLAPVVRGRKGEYKDLLEELRGEGFTRAKIDGELRLLEEEIELDKKFKHDIAVIVDRLVMKPEVRRRLADSIEAAVALAEGIVEIEKVPTAGVKEQPKKKRGTGATGARDHDTLVFSEKFACLNCGTSMPELEPRIFSFNSPHGACPRCTGLGSQMEIDPDLVVDPTLTISEGAVLPWSSNSDYHEQLTQAIADKYEIDLDTSWQDLSEEEQDLFLFGDESERVYVSYRNRMGRRRSYMARLEGVVPSLERRYRETDSEYVRERIEEYMSVRPCPACGGARLRPESLAVKVGGLGIHEFTRKSAREALAFLDRIELTQTELQIAARVLKEIHERLRFLDSVGVGYLTLDRAAATLSGGEAQRIRLATQIGSSLVGVLYILDEPSIGLHQRDNHKLLDTLARLRDLGNTVIVVEHDEGTMRAADHIVDLGPGAGEHGGRVVAEGSPGQIERVTESLTGQFLRGKRQIALPAERREPGEGIKILGAAQHNLKQIDVEFPLGVFCCVTGVSGSGKSTLVNEVLFRSVANRLHRAKLRPGAHRKIEGVDRVDKIINIDQSPIGRTPRSNPATYTGVFDHIRELYSRTPEARARGYKPGRFSFNVKGGRCEVCRGDGQIKIEMHFLPDVYVPCEQCHGKRYNRETLDIRFKGKTIADVLEMSVEEALEFFKHIPKVKRRLQTLHDVGLDYIRLGQPATTLSGGEAQRVKLSSELSKIATGSTLYILDEPTTGLHFADVQRLLEVLGRLVDAGNTVVVIEHNLDVIKTADWIIDLGPEGGDDGGRLVAAGTPEQVASVERSYTGQFLSKIVAVPRRRATRERPAAAAA
jgi:excinuclease ABC subunit A